MRKLLLVLLACVSSSMLLAQTTHFVPNTGVGEMTMDGKCVIRVDGVEDLFESYELGVFLANDPNECRGAALVNTDYYQYFNHYMYLLTIYGETNDVSQWLYCALIS